MKKYIYILILLQFSLQIYSQTWVHQTVVSQPLYSAYSYDPSVGWVSGAAGSVYYTSNGGVTWIPRGSAQFGGNSVYSIHALNSTTALCVCNVAGVGRVFKTTDAGATWTNPFSKPNVVFNDIEFINSLTGYVFGNPVALRWYVIRTTNGGNSFDTVSVTRPFAVNVNEAGFPNSVFARQFGVGGPIRIYFGSNMSWIHYTTNAGINWSASQVTPTNQIRAITFIDSSFGFSSGQFTFRTNNGGIIWTQQPLPNSGPYLSFTNAGGFFWYTSGPSIYYSTNNGSSFVFQYTNPSNSLYNHLSMVLHIPDNNMTVLTGWAVTDNGTITKYSETIGIIPIGTTIPNNYSLKQNYPNPFNPKTKIQFDIPKNSYVKLNVYDILGNIVESIYEGQLKAGSYKTDFDASNLSSGIYFYKLLTGNFSETKRMVVVK